jgi:hypothetical protein
MNKRSKTRINAFITAEAVPKRLKGSDAMAQPQGRSIIKLVDDVGEATAVGMYWSLKSGNTFPAGGVSAADRHTSG